VREVSLKDWQIQAGQWSDPGAGADLNLPLRPASYQMMVVLSRAQEKSVSADGLSITFNGKPLPPLVAAKKSSGFTLETTIPREAFTAGESQTLRFSRKNEPVKVWEVRLIDPTYSILDYLNYAKQKHPDLSFASAWWDAPRVKYPLCGVIGLVFFGGVWPTLIKLLIGAESRQAGGPKYDLDRFHGDAPREEPVAMVPPDGDELSDLEDELRKSLELQNVASNPSKSAAAPAPVQLTAEPVAPIPAANPDHLAHYEGEYYPVVRPIVDKDEV